MGLMNRTSRRHFRGVHFERKNKMKPLNVKFEFKNGETGKIEIFNKPIEFPEKAPIAFHAVCQWGYEVFHQEKLALKKRIEELEKFIAESQSHEHN